VKKVSLLVLLIAVLVTGTAFAQPAFRISAGVGGFFANDFGGGFKISGNYPYLGSFETKIEMPNSGFGGYAFFDVTYAELSVGYFSSKGTMSMKTNLPLPFSDTNYTLSCLNLCLLGKYPIAINDKFSFFPLLGIEVQFGLSAKIDGRDYINPDGKKDPGDWSTMWFKAGVGGDYSLTDQIYIRLNILYGISGPRSIDIGIPGETRDNLIGHGLTAKLAIGFKF
jgi:opacity protein-like surface antigen